MLRTVLLLDGSAIMNSAADYLPSYCLALRTPILQCVAEYLDSTPLATMGVVVMRDGVSRRLSPCTSNSTEIAEALERDYFLVGGSGVFSLENGLRMAMSELVDVRKVRAATAGTNSSHDPTRLRVLLVSASVTLIDPTDVFAVIRLMAQLHIEVHCVSLCGAVHVFDEAARLTGGVMHCPLHFGHLQRILHGLALQLGVEGRAGPRSGRRTDQKRRQPHQPSTKNKASRKRTRAVTGENDKLSSGDAIDQDDCDDSDEEEGERAGVEMIAIGFPLYAPAASPSSPLLSSSSAIATSNRTERESYLICPQCHLIQTAVPTICRLCRLQLCSVPVLYTGFVRHSPYALLAPTTATSNVNTTEATVDAPHAKVRPTSSADAGERKDAHRPQRCAACQQPLCHASASSPSTHRDASEGGSTSPNAVGPGGGRSSRGPVECTGCEAWRCATCDVFIREHLGLCPTCLSSV